MTIIEAFRDPELFGRLPLFADLASWNRWLVFHKAWSALPMTADEMQIYTRHTGRQTPPTTTPSEVYVAAGRRSGKSFMAALIAVFLSCFRDYRPYLAPGERAMVLCIANDRDQAAIILRYIRAFLTDVPMLAATIERETADSIELTNRVTIAVATCSYRAVRGVTLVAAIADEIAFWRVDGANPAHEVLTALRPAMATIPGALLLCISTPYSKSGVLYEALRDYHGTDHADVLTWRATSLEMNPTLSSQRIDRARQHDAAAAASEWDAEFRADLETFLDVEMLTACIETDVTERPPVEGIAYVAAVDMSGGGPDASVLAIAHAEKRGGEAPPVVLDLCRGWRTPNVEAVVGEMAEHLRRYRATQVVGDKYAGEWVPAAFKRHGISYRHATRTRSEAYIELHPLIATGRAALLDHGALLKELRQLERRTGRGRDVVDHPPRLHDDHANAAALALVAADVRTRSGIPKNVGDIFVRRIGGGSGPIDPMQRFLER